MTDQQRLEAIVDTYKRDPESVYNTWFINNEARLKAFRAIRRGVEQVVKDIKEGVFPADFRGSSLEVVLTAITEQKQVFEGAAHPFYWKPKLRIPDIYENSVNKSVFGQFLESCLEATKEEQIVREITKLSKAGIKGLGPAVANILYFIHPTILPPFNTAIVKGFNLLFEDKKQLGSWDSYLEMRDMILQVNDQVKHLLSKDLGAISGLFYDIGVGIVVTEENASLVVEAAHRQKRRREITRDVQEERTHTEIQYLLLKIGKSLGYDVIAASNDRGREFDGQKFSFISLPRLPRLSVSEDVGRTIDLIDVIWFEKNTNKIVCAFEVEKTTTIVTGIERLSDLALTLPPSEKIMLYLVAPEGREKEVVAQLKRPSMQAKAHIKMSYILFSELCKHCDAICKFGEDYTILQKVAKTAD